MKKRGPRYYCNSYIRHRCRNAFCRYEWQSLLSFLFFNYIFRETHLLLYLVRRIVHTKYWTFYINKSLCTYFPTTNLFYKFHRTTLVIRIQVPKTSNIFNSLTGSSIHLSHHPNSNLQLKELLITSGCRDKKRTLS